MSLLKNLFSSNPASLEKKADALFAAGDFGPAKLAYEKALAAASEQARDVLEEKMHRCLDAIARRRVDEARAYLADGSIELAAQEIEGALEVAIDEAIVAEASALLDGLEADDARERATVSDMTDEERIAILMGQWEEAQAEEYEGYGEEVLEALVQLHKERVDEALATLESLVKAAPNPRYLWLEVGRARLLRDDMAGGRDALERFLEALDDEDAKEPRIATHLTLARLADEEGAFEQAMAHLEGAVQAAPQDYRPFLAMGSFLREKGHASEALEVLTSALELSRQMGTDWRLFEELGLAAAQSDKTDEAIGFLEQVIEFFTTQQVNDFPPTTARPLARMYESQGRLERAADMYRSLSQGSDRERHASYHYEAGRLLIELGLTDEARRMLTRARALTSAEDAELREQIDSLLGL